MDNEDWPYTEEVLKHIHRTKARLPKDFPFVTDVLEDYCIVISIEEKHFNWRAVEDRLAIVIELETLKNAIRETGIQCFIDKPKSETTG